MLRRNLEARASPVDRPCNLSFCYAFTIKIKTNTIQSMIQFLYTMIRFSVDICSQGQDPEEIRNSNPRTYSLNWLRTDVIRSQLHQLRWIHFTLGRLLHRKQHIWRQSLNVLWILGSSLPTKSWHINLLQPFRQNGVLFEAFRYSIILFF